MKTQDLKSLIEKFNRNEETVQQTHKLMTIARFSNSKKELVTIAKYGNRVLQYLLTRNPSCTGLVCKALTKYAKDLLILDTLKGKVPELILFKERMKLYDRRY